MCSNFTQHTQVSLTSLSVSISSQHVTESLPLLLGDTPLLLTCKTSAGQTDYVMVHSHNIQALCDSMPSSNIIAMSTCQTQQCHEACHSASGYGCDQSLSHDCDHSVTDLQLSLSVAYMQKMGHVLVYQDHSVPTEVMQQCREAHHDASSAVFWLQPPLTMLDQPPYLFTCDHNFSQSSINCCLTRVS